MASQFRKRRKLPVIAASIVGKKRFKKVKTPLVYHPLGLGSQENEHSSQSNTATQTVEQDYTASDCASDEGDLFDQPPSSQLHSNGGEMTAHYQRRERAASAWDDLLSPFIYSTVCMSCVPPSAVCVRCKVVVASIRCKQCGPTTLLCDMCTVEHHGDESFLGNVFHTPEKWINGQFRRFKYPSTLVLKTTHSCLTRYTKDVVCVDDTGTQHQVRVVFCQCESERVTLLRLNLWAATPSRPTLAFSIDLLLRMKIVMLDCQVAVMDFAQALETHSKLLGPDYPQFRRVYPTIIDSFEAFRYYHFKLHTLDGIATKPDDFSTCPACPQNDEAGAIVHISYDALFGLCRKKTAGLSVRKPYHQRRYCADQTEVDTFIDSYPSARVSSQKGCNDFLAGSVVRSRQRYAALDETAVGGLACRHEFPLLFLNFKFGERIGYAVYLLDKLLQLYSSDNLRKLFLYDIGCTLKHHLKTRKNPLADKFKFAVPVFHSYGHVTQCQLEFSPRYQDGFGLTDGEVLERLWSYMRRFARMTKEMRPSHRVDVLSDALAHFAYQSSINLGCILVERLNKAERLLQSTSRDLEVLRIDSSGDPLFTSDDIKGWYTEDRSKGSASIEGGQVDNKWQECYVQHLNAYWTIQCDLQSCDDAKAVALLSRKLVRVHQKLQGIENENGVSERWKAGTKVYEDFLCSQSVKKCLKLFYLIQSSARQRWFMLLIKAKFSEGHTMTHKISANITNTTKRLKKTILEYNKNASMCCLDNEAVPKEVTWVMVSDISSYLWVSPSSSGHIAVPADVRRDAINKFFLQQRAQEEIELIKLEMKRFICSLHKRIRTLTTSLPTADDQTIHEMGKGGMINSRIRELCNKTVALRKLFSPYYTDDQELPNADHTFDPCMYSPEDLDEERKIEVEYWHSMAEEHIEQMQELEASEQDSFSDSTDSGSDSD